MTPDFTLIWPLSCLKDRVHLCDQAARDADYRLRPDPSIDRHPRYLLNSQDERGRT